MTLSRFKSLLSYGTSALGIRLVSVATSLVTFAVAARILSVTEFSLFGLGFAWWTIASIILDLGNATYIPNEVSAREGRVVSTVVWTQVMLKLSTSALLVFIAYAITYAYASSGLNTGFLFFAVLPLALSRSIYELLGWLSYASDATFRAVPWFGLSQVVLLATLVLQGSTAERVYLLASVFSTAVTTAILVVKFRSAFEWSALRQLRSTLLTSLPYLGYSLVGLLYTQTDPFFVAALLDLQAVGTFQLATRMLFTAEMGAAALATSYMVHFARQRSNEKIAPKPTAFLLPTLFGVGAATTLAVFATPIITIIGGAKYAGAAQLLRVLALSLPFRYFSYAASSLATARFHHTLRLTTTLASALSLFTLYTILIPEFGLYGAAGSLVLSSIFQASIYVVYLIFGSYGGVR